MVRTDQLGPLDLSIFGATLFGERYKVLFKIPAGAVVTLVSIMPPINTPPTWVRATLYPSKDIAAGIDGEKYPYQLIPAAYPWGGRDFPQAAIWEGRHRVDDNFEYTLEVLVHDGSGATTPIWKAIVIVEVDE